MHDSATTFEPAYIIESTVRGKTVATGRFNSEPLTLSPNPGKGCTPGGSASAMTGPGAGARTGTETPALTNCCCMNTLLRDCTFSGAGTGAAATGPRAGTKGGGCPGAGPVTGAGGCAWTGACAM